MPSGSGTGASAIVARPNAASAALALSTAKFAYLNAARTERFAATATASRALRARPAGARSIASPSAQFASTDASTSGT